MFFQVTKNTRQLTNVDSWERVTNVGIFSKPWLILLCLGTSDWGCWAAGHFFWQWIQLFKSCQFCRWCYLHGKKETSKRHLQITTFLLTPNQKEGHIFFLFFFGGGLWGDGGVVCNFHWHRGIFDHFPMTSLRMISFKETWMLYRMRSDTSPGWGVGKHGRPGGFECWRRVVHG